MPGATGTVGHHLVEVLEKQGHDVVAISRSNGVDVITGDGLAPRPTNDEGGTPNEEMIESTFMTVDEPVLVSD